MLTADLYRSFAVREARGQSACYEEWAEGIAADPELLQLIDLLPGDKKQPNLVFAAARSVGVRPGRFADIRADLLAAWPAIRAVALTRRTQTNEAGRLAVLLPVLAALPQPLALLEVGASAGLCLYPDRYAYDYGNGRRVGPADGVPVLTCTASGPVPIPDALPEVVWRTGIDLHPLDVSDDEDVRWLDTLIWPGQDARRRQLASAVSVARADPPRLVRGDLTGTVAAVAAEAPSGATLVVFHSAVLAYLPADARRAFADTVTGLPAHWISNEGSTLDLFPRRRTARATGTRPVGVRGASQLGGGRLRRRVRAVPAVVRLTGGARPPGSGATLERPADDPGR